MSTCSLTSATQKMFLFFFKLTEPRIVTSMPLPSTTEISTKSSLPNIRKASTKTSSSYTTAETQLQGIPYSEILSTTAVGLVIIVAIVVAAIIVLVVMIWRKKRKLPRNPTQSTESDDVQRYGTTLTHSADFNIKDNVAYDACKFEQSYYAYVEVQPNSLVREEMYESVVYENSSC